MPTSEHIEEFDRWINSVVPLPEAEVNANPDFNSYVAQNIKDNDAIALQDNFLEAKKTELKGLSRDDCETSWRRWKSVMEDA